MIRRLLPALIAATAGAQVWVDPKLPDGRKAIERFESAWTLTNPDPLKCEVRPIQPMLTFSFRYQAGFFLTLPLYQMDPGGSQVTMITSVRPLQAAQPVYFLQSFKVPKFPFENVSKRVAGEAGGGFYLGPGEYEVRWLLEDHRGRRCAESWKTRLKLSRAEKKQPQPLEPDTITPLILSGWNAESREGRPYRISILLHAAPSRLRGTALHPFDQALLISSVAALLEKTSMVEVSVTAFNLNQQRELLNVAKLDLASFRRLMGALDELKLGTIGLDILGNPAGVPQLIDQVVRRELKRPDPPDAIIFIGPNSRYEGTPPPELLREIAGPRPPLFYYLHLTRFQLPWKDGLERLVDKLDGETRHIWRPDDLADAIRDLENRLRRRADGR